MAQLVVGARPDSDVIPEVEEIVVNGDSVSDEVPRDEILLDDEQEEVEDEDEGDGEDQEDVEDEEDGEGEEDVLEVEDHEEGMRSAPGDGSGVDVPAGEGVSGPPVLAVAGDEGSQSGYRVSKVGGRVREVLICLILGMLRLAGTVGLLDQV